MKTDSPDNRIKSIKDFCKYINTDGMDAEYALYIFGRLVYLMNLIQANQKGQKKREFKLEIGDVQYDLNEMQRTGWKLVAIIRAHQQEDLSGFIPDEFQPDGIYSKHL